MIFVRVFVGCRLHLCFYGMDTHDGHEWGKTGGVEDSFPSGIQGQGLGQESGG